MSMSLLIVGAAALAAVQWVMMMGLFGPGKKEFEELREEKEKAEKRVEKLEARVEELKKKADKAQEQAQAADEEKDKVKAQLRQNKDESKKITRLELQLSQAAREQEDYRLAREHLVKELQDELKSLKEKSVGLEEKVRAQSREVERLTVLASAPPPPPPPPPPQVIREEVQRPAPRVDPGKEEALKSELKELKEQLRVLQKDNQEMERRLRATRRMIEHNRRAYIVTSLQLDLAVDELHLLKTGKQRRQTARSQQQVPQSNAAESQPIEPCDGEEELPEELASVAMEPCQEEPVATLESPAASLEKEASSPDEEPAGN